MELIIVIVILVLLLFISLPFIVFSLMSRVRKLEDIIRSQYNQASPASPTATARINQVAPTMVVTPPAATAKAAPPVQFTPTEPDVFSRFGDWLKENWLLKLGALLLIIGFGWLTSYAFLNNWIGPVGRISLGLIFGAVVMIFGWIRMNKYPRQGGVFLVLGSTVILLTIFAAREVYGFFTQISALVVMFLSCAFVAISSVKYNSTALALSSLILASVAPLLTAAQTNNPFNLFAYLFVVCLGAVWIVALTGKRVLTTASVIIIWIYSLGYLDSYITSELSLTLLLIYAFCSLFFITNLLGIIKNSDKKYALDLITAALNGLLLLAWIVQVAPTEWQSLIIATWMLVFAVGAFLAFKLTGEKKAFIIHAATAVIFLGTATAAELQGSSLTIAYTIEAFILTVLTHYFTHDSSLTKRVSMIYLIPIILSVQSIDAVVWSSGVIHRDFFVLLVLMLSLLFTSLWVLADSEKKDTDGNMASAWLIGASIYLYILIWQSTHAAIDNGDTATMISLIIYTLFGLFIYFYGKLHDHHLARRYGGILLGLVIARLFLVDIWNMELVGKIITFFLVGGLLMSTAFIGKDKK